MMIYLLLLLLLCGCSGLEKSAKEKIRQNNLVVDPILRRSADHHYAISEVSFHPREKYPWETKMIGNLRRINKEYFRCRGNPLHNPRKIISREGKEVYQPDCGGVDRHSLPIKNKQEFIYPILIDLLNYVQEKTGGKVTITCGHRCPTHNLYSDPATKAQYSKHLIGAEVDFYVEGLSYEEVIPLLMEYYKETPWYEGKNEYQTFQRYQKGDLDVLISPWYNKEVFIKYYQLSEGRDLDNTHSRPYFSIQVRYDPKGKRRVLYSWHEAFNGYYRY